MLQRVCKVICFIVIFVMLFGSFHKIFSFKSTDGIYSMRKFYQEPEQSIDVLFLGSSHIFENVNTAILWDKYGIAGYDLCGSVQPIWNTYYYLNEALKTQTPCVIVVDVLSVASDGEYADHSRIVKNNYGLKFSIDKIRSILVSSSPSLWPDYLLEFPSYHTRYKEISKSDYMDHNANSILRDWKGFGLNTETTSLSQPQNFYTEEVEDLPEKAEKYLKEIIHLAKDKNIPLVLIKTPYGSIDEHAQKRYNMVGKIAEENDIPFINYNLLYDEMKLDFNCDFADTSHLNHLGNVKFTNYLATYLKANYEIPDRRGHSEYKNYARMAEMYNQQMFNKQQIDIQDREIYISNLKSSNTLTVYSLTGDYKNASNYMQLREELKEIGVNLDNVQGNSIWIIEDDKVIYESYEGNTVEWYRALREGNRMKLVSSVESTPYINYNGTTYSQYSEGLYMLIYNMETNSLVECVEFPLVYDEISNSKQIVINK